MIGVSVRRAVAGDEREVLRLIVALATYEHQRDAVTATEASLTETLFNPNPQVFAHLAELNGRAVGLALWFLTYSTWTARPSLYVEDIYVDEGCRGRGIGRRLFEVLGEEAAARNCARIDWAVLDWNDSAMAFYRRLGARPTVGWQNWRLEGAAYQQLIRRRYPAR
jgi:GNAT superfamily N-acetyltransferase